ncbi:MAG: hypothetical protein PHR37_06520 [Eubacteriales bacterium]|nr:hypothetical protein [Eubacteriales bacterium]
MKFFAFIKNHKILTFCLIVFLIIVLVTTITLWALSSYYAVVCTTFTKEAYDTFSITFDKPDMMRVNKAEIETPKGITVIEDLALIKDIVKCTLVAKYSGIDAMYNRYYIRLYSDDILIRDMDLSLYNNLIRVYYPDEKHFMLYGGKDGGQVIISQELLDKIKQYLVENGNNFGNVDGSYPDD